MRVRHLRRERLRVITPFPISVLVPGYLEVGISRRDAVRYIVDSHMRSARAPGRGSKARRRSLTLLR